MCVIETYFINGDFATVHLQFASGRVQSKILRLGRGFIDIDLNNT